ncbi:MAG: hypothetical protein SVU32_01575, partial [Candidatus Nanohaloarchaea archaeon]|nr:hypothetical protein [Candidatus Nanohaloarchaea archaeon]
MSVLGKIGSPHWSQVIAGVCGVLFILVGMTGVMEVDQLSRDYRDALYGTARFSLESFNRSRYHNISEAEKDRIIRSVLGPPGRGSTDIDNEYLDAVQLYSMGVMYLSPAVIFEPGYFAYEEESWLPDPTSGMLFGAHNGYVLNKERYQKHFQYAARIIKFFEAWSKARRRAFEGRNNLSDEEKKRLLFRNMSEQEFYNLINRTLGQEMNRSEVVRIIEEARESRLGSLGGLGSLGDVHGARKDIWTHYSKGALREPGFIHFIPTFVFTFLLYYLLTGVLLASFPR